MQLSGHEDLPFTGEPHQPAYYPKLWEAAGFKLTESYLSNFYPKVSPTTQEAKLAKRYEAALAAGIKIRSPHKSDWTEVSLQVFELLNRLYRDFPIYRSLQGGQFSAIFEKYRYILDFSMVKLAYQEEKLVGFLITMPDYGALKERFRNDKIETNSQMSQKHIKKYIKLSEKLERIIEMAYDKYKFSARSFNKILKLSRTIADLRGSDEISSEDLLEAIRFRNLDKKYWGY